MPTQRYDSIRRNKALNRKRKQEQKRLLKQARKSTDPAIPAVPPTEAPNSNP